MTASREVNVPSRLPPRKPSSHRCRRMRPRVAAHAAAGRRGRPRRALQGQLSDLQAMVKELCRRSTGGGRHDLPEELFRLFTDLLDSDLSEDVARELVERVRAREPRRGNWTICCW